MASEFLMTWREQGKRWVKKNPYGGPPLCVSCRQLGVPPTQRDSWKAANEWCRAKLEELKNEHKPVPGSDAARKKLLEIALGRPLEETADVAMAFTQLMETLDKLPLEQRAPILQAFTGRDVVDEAKKTVDTFIEDSAKKKPTTFQGWIDAWNGDKQRKVDAGEIDQTRANSYKSHLKYFMTWAEREQQAEPLSLQSLEAYHAYLTEQIAKNRKRRQTGQGDKGYSAHYAWGIWQSVNNFLSYLEDREMYVKPKLLRTLKIKKPKGRKETWKIAKVRELLAACDKFGRERLKLYVLLMLNIGMYQNDISELDETEVNWERGIITRPRSKTPDGPIAKYKLWPEAFVLLQKFRNGDESIKVEKHGEFKTRVLVTNEGRPLIQGNRTDNIQSMYRSLLKKLQGKWQALMHLRKTSANVLGNLGKKKEYRIYCRYFLAQADRGTTDEYYIKVGPKERRHFFQGLRRLRMVFIPKETNGQKIQGSTDPCSA